VRNIRVGAIRPGSAWVLVLVAILLFTACDRTGMDGTAESKAVVRIADIAPITGPAAAPEQINFQAQQDYIRYFNEQNRIPGVRIQFLWADTGMERSRFINAYRRFIEDGVFTFYSDDTPSILGIKSQLEKNRTPFVSGSVSAPVIHPPGWAYCLTPTFGEVSTTVLDYFMQHWQEDRRPKVIYFGGDDYMARVAAEEAAPYAESIGMEMLPWEFIPYVVIDATAQLLRAKDQGADLVMLQQIVPGTGPTLRDAERLGLMGQMQFGGIEYTIGDTLIHMVGEAAEGFLAPRTTPWYDETDVPGIQTLIQVQEKYHGRARCDPEYMGGWLGASIMCEAIRRALDEVGHDDLDGAAIKEAYDGMTGFNVDGLATITYTPEQRRGTRKAAVYQVQGGSIVRVGDWHETPILVP